MREEIFSKNSDPHNKIKIGIPNPRNKFNITARAMRDNFCITNLLLLIITVRLRIYNSTKKLK